MQKNIILRSLVVLAVFCVIFGMLENAWAQSPEEDVFGVIKLSNPQELMPKIAQFIDKFQPGMGGMVNPMMVGNMVFQNPEWTGMDMAGEYTAVVLNPMKYGQAPFALILPLTGKDEYIGAISQTLSGGKEVDGIYNFTRPNQKTMFAAFVGNNGIISDDQNVATQVKMLVESDSAILKEAPAVKGQLAAMLSMNKILMAVRPMIEMLKQQMLMGMQQNMGEGAEAPPGATITNVVQAEVDMLLSLLDQTDKLHLGVGIEDDGLRLSKAVFAMSGSNMEKFLAAQTPKKSSLLGLMPPDGGIIGSASLTLTPEFIEGYLEFIKTMTAMSPEMDAQKAVDMTRQYLEIFGGDAAFGGLSQAEESLFVEVLTVTDAAKAKQLTEENPEMLNTFLGMYKEMGVDLSLSLADKAEVTGGEILNYNFDMKAEMIPDPGAQEAFNKVFGENISMPVGFTGNYAVVGFGKNPRTQVEKLMGQLDSGAETAAQYTPSMFGLPEENNMFMYLSAPKILAWVAKIAPDAPPFEIVEGPGLAMASRIVDNHVEAELFLPVEEIQAIQNMVMQAQMQPAASGGQ